MVQYSIPWGEGGGGHSPQFRMRVCRWVPGNLTLFQTKETWVCYPVPDKMSKFDTLLQHNSSSVCLQHNSGWKKVTLTLTMFQSLHGQKYSLFQTEMLICRPCSKLREEKTVPCWATHLCHHHHRKSMQCWGVLYCVMNWENRWTGSQSLSKCHILTSYLDEFSHEQQVFPITFCRLPCNATRWQISLTSMQGDSDWRWHGQFSQACKRGHAEGY